MPFCTQCGHANPDESRFCSNCGASLRTATQPAAAETSTITIGGLEAVPEIVEGAEPALSPADQAAVDALPDRAVESFAGVGNPFSLRRLQEGERVVDVGSGAGFDSFIAAGQVGESGRVVGVDMTAEMLDKSRATASALGFNHVDFREGLAEELPVEGEWADAVISNGVINLCADKQAAFHEICRVLKPGGWLQFADIANGRPVPLAALRDIDLWTG